MRILGLDPGTAIVGYGIVEERDGEVALVTYGALKTAPKDGDTAHRLQLIYQGINELLAEFEPDMAAVEQLFFGRNITTAINVGQAGVCYSWLWPMPVSPSLNTRRPRSKKRYRAMAMPAKNRSSLWFRTYSAWTRSPNLTTRPMVWQLP